METAVLKLIELISPKTKIQTCYFHYTQILWRNLQKYGLQKLFYLNSCFRYDFKMLCSLPNVPNIELNIYFNVFKKNIKQKEYYSEIECFINYYEKKIINSNNINNIGKYMCVNESILNNIPITTNTSEAWNRGPNKSFDVSHPKFDIFINELKKRDFHVSGQIYETLNDRFLNKKYLKQIKNMIRSKKYYNIKINIQN
ncbi:hypothetical protein DMUE_5562 [Dictyocoela muelleri]|nr:hypothetical protein DMUE_5562 [Dictyocoela muelleri]